MPPAPSRILSRLASLSLLALAACTEGGTGPGGGGGIFGGISLGNSGLGGPGFVGFMDTDLPRAFSYLFDSAVSGGGVDGCRVSGRCGHGGGTTQYASLAGSDSLLFITTSDFPVDPGDPGSDTAVVVVSGVQHDSLTFPASAAGKELRLTFEFAFLQSSAVAQDSAVIHLEIDGQRVRVFRVTGGDIGGTLAARAGGCGTEDIGRAVSFPRCSDWQSRQIDLTPYRGKRTPILFIVGEGGSARGRAVTLLIRSIRFEEEQ